MARRVLIWRSRGNVRFLVTIRRETLLPWLLLWEEGIMMRKRRRLKQEPKTRLKVTFRLNFSWSKKGELNEVGWGLGKLVPSQRIFLKGVLTGFPVMTGCQWELEKLEKSFLRESVELNIWTFPRHSQSQSFRLLVYLSLGLPPSSHQTGIQGSNFISRAEWPLWIYARKMIGSKILQQIPEVLGSGPKHSTSLRVTNSLSCSFRERNPISHKCAMSHFRLAVGFYFPTRLQSFQSCFRWAITSSFSPTAKTHVSFQK